MLTNLTHSVTQVTVNAGSGKSTLVADFLRTHERQFVWYQLDRTDADPLVFLGYLTFGIQQVVPDFGKAMFAYLKEGSAELTQNPERAVDVLLNEVLERPRHPAPAIAQTPDIFPPDQVQYVAWRKRRTNGRSRFSWHIGFSTRISFARIFTV